LINTQIGFVWHNLYRIPSFEEQMIKLLSCLLAAPDDADITNCYDILIFGADHNFLLVALSGNQNTAEASADADEGI
jgi:hypothetical protein